MNDQALPSPVAEWVVQDETGELFAKSIMLAWLSVNFWMLSSAWKADMLISVVIVLF